MHIVIFLVMLVAGTILFIKLKNSRKVDNFVNNIFNELDLSTKDTNTLIKDVEEADDSLVQRAEVNEKVVEKIQKEQEKISKFRNVAPKDIEESEDK